MANLTQEFEATALFIYPMSLGRQRVLVRCRRSRLALPATQARRASDSHSRQQDSNVYPQEGFNTPFWRNTLILSFLGIGIYNLIPYLDKDGSYVTRYIQHYATPSDVWTRINQKHLELAMEAARGQLLIRDAERPRVFRMRNPASFDQGSPHCIAVGAQADVSNVVVKKDKAWAE